MQPALVDNEGNPLEGATEGSLVITDSWPGQARTLFGDHERFEQTYFSTFKNMYFSGDGARRDEDGYYWITGRVDDVLNVSGHRLGTAEIESALVAHPKIAEAAVVGIPHNIKGTQKSATGCVKRLARWRRQTCCTGPTPCLKPAPAKLCAVFCAKLRRAIPATWAIPRRLPILA